MDDKDISGRNRMEDTGTRIHVEKDHRPSWLWLLVPLILGLLVLPNFFNRHKTVETGTNIQQPARIGAFGYMGSRWTPVGTPQTIAASDLRAVGHADNGQQVYTMPSSVGGGGGQAEQRIYTKTADGRFQPLVELK